MHTTPASLLEQLRQSTGQDGTSSAWSRFVQLYTPLLYYWARRLGLQEPDAADLSQEIFTTLLEKLPRFRYDQSKSFRSWLRTVTLNKWRDRQRQPMLAYSAAGEEALSNASSPEDPEWLGETEYRQQLARRALYLMQTEFAPNTWKACWEHVVAGRPAAEVAAELGISLGSVYVAKSRVLSRLRRLLEGLLD
jgi:RNA polymerase sigma-70 factor (ECF subfamily)